MRPERVYMTSIPDRFIRNIGVFTEGEQTRLLDSTVAVVGLGCTGCAIVEFLARAGIGGFVLVDGDRFAQSNANRQLYAKSSTLGEFKVNAAKHAVLDINPEARVVAHNVFLEPGNANGFLKDGELIINGVDDPSTMVIIHRTARALAKPSAFVLSGGIPFHGVCCIIPADGAVDYETFMGLPTANESLDACIANKSALFSKITEARVHSALQRGTIPGPWVESRLKGGPSPSFGITSNIISLVAANEVIKTLIKRQDLEPVYAPNLIHFDGARCEMSVRAPESGRFWFQGDF